MKRYGLAVLAGFFMSAVAVAGPIEWTYTATLGGDRGAAHVAAGRGGRPDMTEPNGMREYFGYTELTTAPFAGPQAGNALLTIGSLPGYSNFYWLNESESAPPIDENYLAAVTITDTASGESGTVSVIGPAVSSDAYLGLPADLDLPAVSQIRFQPAYELVLGGNTYRVWFAENKVDFNPNANPGASWTRLDVIAEVEVVSPLSTPEPATLLLAGVGVAVVGLAMRRRKSTAVPR